MSWEQEKQYQRFRSYLKVIEWRANDEVREKQDEEAKTLAEEYKTIRKKLEAIDERRKYALITEENEESKMRKEILEIVEDEYSDDPKKFNEESNKIYEKIKEIISGYVLEKQAQNDEKNKTKEGKTEEGIDR